MRVPYFVLLVLLALCLSSTAYAEVPTVSSESVVARFDGPTEGLTTTSGRLGTSLAALDINNSDKSSVLAMGEPFGDPNATGSVYINFRAAASSSFTGTWDLAASQIYQDGGALELTGAAPGDRFGFSMAHVPDYTGDLRDELLIGAPGADGEGRTDPGRVYLITSQAITQASQDPNNSMSITTLMSTIPNWGFAITGTHNGASTLNQTYLGTSVAPVNDMNGDGRPEIITGDPLSGTGVTYVVFGKDPASGAANNVDLAGAFSGITVNGNASSSGGTGYGVVGISDVGSPGGAHQQDGIPDFAVADPNETFSGRNNAGVVYVLWGRNSTTTLSLDLVGGNFPQANGYQIGGATANDRLAAADSPGTTPYRSALLSKAADINGDGQDELLIGQPLQDVSGAVDSGSFYAVYVEKDRDLTTKGNINLQLGPSSKNATPQQGVWNGMHVISGGQTGENLGYGATARDLNHDNTPDLVIGAPGTNSGSLGAATGAAYVVYGARDFSEVKVLQLKGLGWKIIGPAAGSRFGYATLGLKGWNTPDFIAPGRVAIGAPTMDNNGRTDSGSVYVTNPPAPTGTTLPAENVGSTSATLVGTINPHDFGSVVARFEFTNTQTGATTTTADQVVSNGNTSVRITTDVSLAPCTTYSYRIRGENNDGFSVTGEGSARTAEPGSMSFTTSCGSLEIIGSPSSSSDTTTGVSSSLVSCADSLVAANAKSVTKYVSFAGTKVRLEGPTGGYALAGSKQTFKLRFSRQSREANVQQVIFYVDGKQVGKTVKKPQFDVTFSTKDLTSSPNSGTKHVTKAIATTRGKKGKDKTFSLSWRLSDCKRTRFSVSVRAVRKHDNSKADVTATLNGVGAAISSGQVKLSKYLKLVPKAKIKAGKAKLTVAGKSKTLTLKLSKKVKKTSSSLTLYSANGTKISLRKKKGTWTAYLQGLPSSTTKVSLQLLGSKTGFVRLKQYCSKAAFTAKAKGGNSGNTVSLNTKSTRSCKK